MAEAPRTAVVVGLGISQTIAWASSYYLLAMLATPMASELGLSVPMVFAAFTLALIISAFLGPRAGRLIDRHGGRPVLAATNLLFAAGLSLLALAEGPLSLYGAWLIIGVAMGAGLYDAAFASLVRLYGQGARNAITGITLIAGFASTIGWPLTALLAQTLGWRGACWGWVVLHLLVALPLNLRLPSATAPVPVAAPSPQPEPRSEADGTPLMPALLLALVFAVTWFVSTAMAAHLPALLQTQGLSLGVALGVAALVGPAQVVARLLEFGLMRRLHPLFSAQLATIAHPIGAFCLIAFGGPAALVFALAHGAGNGILTIAKGTLPLVVFGAHGYGERQGLLMAPARFAQAFAPLLFGLAMEHYGGGALWWSAGLGLLAFAALCLLKKILPRG